MKRSMFRDLALAYLISSGAASTAKAADPPADAATTTVYRDEYGIPHVYAPTLEAASYAIGYAQAEDRLEELLKNYRRAAGTMAEVFGPEFYAERPGPAHLAARGDQPHPLSTAQPEAAGGPRGVYRGRQAVHDGAPRPGAGLGPGDPPVGHRRPVAAHHLGLADGRGRRRASGGRSPAHAAGLPRLERDAHRPGPHGDEGPDRRRRPAPGLVRLVPLLRGPDLRPRRRIQRLGRVRSSASRSPASATAGIAPSP